MEDINTGSAILTGTPAVDSNSAINQGETQQVEAQTLVANTTTEPSQTDSQNQSKWYSNIKDDDLRGYAELRNWQNQEDVVKSYRELESLMGADKAGRGVVLPKEDDAEGWTKFYQKLGAPTDAKDYKLPVPEGQPTEFADTASQWMLEAGLTTKQAQLLANKMNEYSKQQQENYQNQINIRAQEETQDLMRELGDLGYAKLVEAARRGAEASGDTKEELTDYFNKHGERKTLEKYANLGKKFGEHFIAKGSNSEGPMSREAAQVKYDMLKQDQNWVNSVLKGSPKEYMEQQELLRIIGS